MCLSLCRFVLDFVYAAVCWFVGVVVGAGHVVEGVVIDPQRFDVWRCCNCERVV